MSSCGRKERCLSGPNAGLAYDPASPCPPGYSFNALACDCESSCEEGPATAVIKWKVSYASYTGQCSPVTTLCFDFGNTPYTLTVNDLVPGTQIELGTQGTGVTGTCSGSENTTVVATYLACVDGSPAFTTQVLGSPGCSVNTSAGAIATIYDEEIIYG